MTAEEGGYMAVSRITVKPLIDLPDPLSKPTSSGYGYVHPLSLANINMTMKVESTINESKLTMTIPDIGLLFNLASGATVKVNNSNLESSRYIVKRDSISIDLGTLTGTPGTPGTYKIAVYVKMEPTDKLGDIKEYIEKVKDKDLLTVSNKLEGSVDIGGSSIKIPFDLESYHLELINIPTVN